LILRDPTREFAVRRVKQQVRLVDVMPTILDLLGLPASPDRTGRSLVPLLRAEPSEPRLAWSEIPHHALVDPGVRWAVRTDSHKLVVTPPPAGRGGEARLELYDLEADARERSNLAARDPGRRADAAAPERLARPAREWSRGLSRGVRPARPGAARAPALVGVR
jgi:arylsulfatase A-like enzyme